MIPDPPNLFLFDSNTLVVHALEQAFREVPKATAHRALFAEIHDVPRSVVVSPANSFGIMDGGIDAAYTAHFGPHIQENVQQRIIKEYVGEQPVGTCFLVETERTPAFLAHAPTMRVPMPIVGTENVYHAMRAMLICVERARDEGELIDTILCPGLGTATGQMSPFRAAYLMRAAWDTLYDRPRPTYLTWEFASGRDRMLNDPPL